MVTHPPGVVERINAHLPPQIRVYGYHRTVKGFDARKACDKRRYEYILPTWMFAPVPEAYKQKGKSTWGARNGGEGAGNLTEDGGEAAGPLEGDAAPLANDAVADANAQSAEEPTEPFQAAEEVAAGLPASPPLADIDVDFRFDEECQRRLTSILRRYEGTHNFHNYTVRTASTAAQAMRYMLSFTCQGTFLIAGKPWVRMVVIGQSFMLHQIRKMVGMAVAEFTGVAQPGSLQYAMNTHEKVNVPMAPDLGLFLDECYYDAYNDRWGDHHEALSLGARYAEEVAKFKEEQLYPLIARRDEDEHVNAVWRRAVTEANYQFSTWPVSGKAPEVERKGEDRRDGEGAAPQAKRRKPYNPEYSE